MDFSEKLKAQRKAVGLSQQKLADLVGVHRVHIAKLESGVHEPNLSTLAALCRALNVPCQVFMPEPENPPGRSKKAKG